MNISRVSGSASKQGDTSLSPFASRFESGEFQHALHHRPDSVKYLVDGGVAHEGAGGDQLVLLVNVALADALAHVFAAQRVDGRRRVGRVGVPGRKKKKKKKKGTNDD